MDKKPSISVVVPAYNEEERIEGTVDAINESLGERFSDHEILIFNDYSTDKTGEISDKLKAKDSHIRVIHNPTNMGFGYNYLEGVRLAEKDYVIMVPGDNEIPREAIKKIFTQVGRADIIVPHTANMEVRPLSRQIVSKSFTGLINLFFGLDLAYYNGTCVHKRSLLKKFPVKTHGFAYMATILVRAIKSGASFTEIGVDIEQRVGGESKAFAIKNVVSVLTALLGLFWEVRIAGRAKYSKRPKRIEPLLE
ncbi:MAG: glycosyltransferase family 2 protein [Proteobacteria bacterium]|nr:glycosyltransferase family 2 protein [Pseudomonadota bacterium]